MISRLQSACGILSLFLLLAAGKTDAGQMVDAQFPMGEKIRLSFLTEDIIRVQIIPGGEFLESGLNRYGFIHSGGGDQGRTEIKKTDTTLMIASPAAVITINLAGKELLVVRRSDSCALIRQTGFAFSRGKAAAEFAADPSEDWVGFGDQTRDRLFHRGFNVDLWVRNVKSYVPVPFFMSTRGAGILVNTTHHIVFDMCASSSSVYSWNDSRCVIDYYILVGGNFKSLLEKYTDLTGKPKLPPDWSFGLWYICRTQANDYEAVNDALNFRREEIPCDVIGLEPGWMEKNYDYSTEKKWSNERFPIPSYAWKGPNNFFNAIQRLGFHMELWLCNDYDHSFEAERRIGGGRNRSISGGAGFVQSGAEVDEHLGTPVYLDRITKRDEAWFEHLKKFVDQGIDFFKQDGSAQVLDHPDRVWGNGMLDGEMHNLYPLLYSKEMYEGFAEYTNRRPVVFTVAGWAGFQSWCGTWTGDTGGGFKTLCAMLNTALVGHSWMTNDMDVAKPETIHFGYLLPWSQINSWNYFRMPWVQETKILEMHQYYGRLRSRLIPYIYSWAHYSSTTGIPLMRPLALEFQDDLKCRDILHEYLLGRDLLVVSFRDSAYFPGGRWKDYWTGEIVSGGTERTIRFPGNRGGGLYIRAGGIIPFGPVMQYRRESALDEIMVYVFPDSAESSCELYEDDGVSFNYREGECSLTRISAKSANARITVLVENSRGTFKGETQQRTWSFTIAVDRIPRGIKTHGEILDSALWKYNEERREVTVKAIQGPCVLEIEE